MKRSKYHRTGNAGGGSRGSRPRRLAPLMLGVALLGCGGEASSPTGLTPDQFVEVMVELREAEWQAVETDSVAVAYDSLKAEVLERHGTSEEEIRQFVQATHRDLPLLEEMWEKISERLRRPVTPDGEGVALPDKPRAN